MYLIGILIGILFGIMFYFLRMCLAFSCRNEGLPWKGLIEPLRNPSMEILMSTYNAFIFIIPSVLISIIFTFMIKRKKNRKN